MKFLKASDISSHKSELSTKTMEFSVFP